MLGLVQDSYEIKYPLIYDQVNRPLGSTGEVYTTYWTSEKIKGKTLAYIISLQIIQVLS